MVETELTNAAADGASEEKTRRVVTTAIVAFTALGLAASAALLVDYLRPIPLFCSETSGCAQLRLDVHSHMLGLPTPAFGVIGYSLLAVLTISRGDTARFLHLVTATFGSLFAGYFLFLQVSLSTYCVYCMTVDISSIILLSLVLLRVRAEADLAWPRDAAIAGGVLACALGAPLLSHVLVRVRVPPVIAAEMKKTPPGQVTIVDFIDFECPYCRQTYADFRPTLASHAGKFRMVRKQTPLVRIHPHAYAAARAACCAESLGKGDEIADALISAPLDQLTDDGCTKMASQLGIDEAKFRACLSDPATQKKIESDQADFKAAQGHALPTIWINDELIEGAEGPDALRKAMDHALGEVGG
jgi:protein-disulfide isomerase/uncharacterized membrane protein